jgi:hypothetical protein
MSPSHCFWSMSNDSFSSSTVDDNWVNFFFKSCSSPDGLKPEARSRNASLDYITVAITPKMDFFHFYSFCIYFFIFSSSFSNCSFSFTALLTGMN